ncbi:hypothetical protein BDF20DRAFT_999099 [Mycotypha africana]|uniref:uncharacterized protein n=1 Tax=Mycotypha africana TaxID=64632 RepID=UPI002300D2FF|nr:uncharacterized protein BDF20DRAFT_999099 [Mycotypha africana]KAI8984008.1 hypothetical protein BDF20DRAFT_999099 [Mycotypha africana]
MGQQQDDYLKNKSNSHRHIIGNNKRRVHPGDETLVRHSDPGMATPRKKATQLGAQHQNVDTSNNRQRFLGGGRLHHPSTLSSASMIQTPAHTTPKDSIKLHHQQYPSFKGGLHYIYMHPGSSSTTFNQYQSMSNVSNLEMHPRIQSKDANYFYIWIDDHYKDLSLSKPLIPPSKMTKRNFTIFSKRGACNMITLLIVFSMILGLFVYPFFTYFYTQQQQSQQQQQQTQ